MDKLQFDPQRDIDDSSAGKNSSGYQEEKVAK